MEGAEETVKEKSSSGPLESEFKGAGEQKKENPAAMRIAIAVLEFFIAAFEWSIWKDTGKPFNLYASAFCLVAGLIILYFGIRNLTEKTGGK